MPYSDHVTELKYLKNVKPEIFKLNNDLSNKNLAIEPENNNTLNTYPLAKVPSASKVTSEDARKIDESSHMRASQSSMERKKNITPPQPEQIDIYQP